MIEMNAQKTYLPAAFRWLAETPYYQAGLAGYSNAAMRIIARRHGCPYCVTESILDEVLIKGGKGRQDAELLDEDHPIAGQLMGTYPREIALGASILVALGYDVIDVNLACPTKKVRRRCRGGLLLSQPDDVCAILRAVRDAVGGAVPMTVKMRRGYDDSAASTENFIRILETAMELGYFSVTVHGRTVEQKYAGPSSWEFLADLTARYPDFPIFGSGDIFTPESIFQMIEKTGVRAVSVARGCIGNPWIFRQAGDLHGGRDVRPPSLDEQRDVLEAQFELSLELHGEKSTARMMRKFGIKFSHHHPQADDVAKAFIAAKSLADWRHAMAEFYVAP